MPTMAPMVVVGSARHAGPLPVGRIAALMGLLVLTMAVIGAGLRSAQPTPARANPILPAVTWLIGDPPVQSLLTLETAVDAGQRRLGLSGRRDVPAGGGMAFLLPRPRRMAMDGRGLLVPVDLVYVGRDWRIVSVERIEPGSTVPMPSQGAVRMAMEVPAGTAGDSGMVQGALVGRMATLDQTVIDAIPDTSGTGMEPIPAP